VAFGSKGIIILSVPFYGSQIAIEKLSNWFGEGRLGMQVRSEQVAHLGRGGRKLDGMAHPVVFALFDQT
jgi:hypothetical protein